jgi:hypothetical protein
MIITLHNNKVHWQFAQPLVSLVDHMVYVFLKDEEADPLIGVVVEYTDDCEMLFQEEGEDDPVLIPLDSIEKIHYP